MSKDRKGSDKLNRKLRVTLVVFLFSGLIALFIILNKGVIFGKRLVAITTGTQEVTHTLELTSDKVYLPEGGEKANLLVKIDGVESLEGYDLVSSDEDVVKIVGNTLISNSTGTAIVTATSTEYDLKSEVTIDVVEPITSITLKSEFRMIEIDEESQLTPQYKPTTATAKISYKSSDESVVTVDENGVATGVSYGVATITVTDEITGYYDEFKITVKELNQ